MFCACSFYGDSMNNLLSYFGLVDARISASEKYLPVQLCHIFDFGKMKFSLVGCFLFNFVKKCLNGQPEIQILNRL